MIAAMPGGLLPARWSLHQYTRRRNEPLHAMTCYELLHGGNISSNPHNIDSYPDSWRPRRSALYVGGRVEVSLDPQPPWLRYKGKWGSTVVAPALQEWCVVELPQAVHSAVLKGVPSSHMWQPVVARCKGEGASCPLVVMPCLSAKGFGHTRHVTGSG